LPETARVVQLSRPRAHLSDVCIPDTPLYEVGRVSQRFRRLLGPWHAASMMGRALGVSLAGTLLWTWLGCSDEERPTASLPVVDECTGRQDGVLCSSGIALTCAAGTVQMRKRCDQGGLICATAIGCRACEPYTTSCDGSRRSVCRRDGSGFELAEVCGEGLSCSPVGCVDLCSAATGARSYLGCDYWPTFTQNSMLASKFRPAVAIGNGNLVPAHVVIAKDGQVVAERDVGPRSAATVELDFDPALQRSTGSILLRQGAYHLTASVPVTVHQFNPLFFQLAEDCPGEEPPPPSASDTDGVCNSYTNDASLLYPSSALAPDVGESEIVFLAAARQTAVYRSEPMRVTPGFLAIVAVGDAPTNVTVRASAHTLASAESAPSDAIEALGPGGTLVRTLAPGDVLQISSAAPTGVCPGETRGSLCDPGAAYDLTGTEIRADGPIQVIGGHDCTYVPFDTVACDHLEESIPPLRAWGTRTLATRPHTDDSTAHVLRVVSGGDQNVISFDPAIRAPLTLGRGEYVELPAGRAVMVRGTDRVLVTQYLVGQGSSGNRYVGDPSMSIGVPVAQFRGVYNFLTPSSYSINYVDIIARTGEVVMLDDKLVSGFVPVGTSGYSVAFLKLDRAGAHEIRGISGQGIGIVLYGLGLYTSYMLPGGLDLEPVPVIVI
jgi:hypothetical protein